MKTSYVAYRRPHGFSVKTKERNLTVFSHGFSVKTKGKKFDSFFLVEKCCFYFGKVVPFEKNKEFGKVVVSGRVS
jgi:hypothetical protein